MTSLRGFKGTSVQKSAQNSVVSEIHSTRYQTLVLSLERSFMGRELPAVFKRYGVDGGHSWSYPAA